MKRATTLAAALLLATAGVRTLPAQTDAQLNDELQALRDKAAATAARVERLEAAAEEITLWAATPKARRQAVNLDALRQVKLPISPTKAEVQEYVRKIEDASKQQVTFSLADPQLVLLMKVGPANVDVLLAHREKCPYYVLAAVRALANATNKDAILAALPAEPELAAVVLEQGWVKDAKPTLCAGLKAKPEYLPPAWVWAVASLRDPATYADLTAYLARGRNPLETWAALRDLPGIDLAPAAGEVWRRGKQETWLAADAARLAVRYGHKDALEALIRALDRDQTQPGGIPNARSLVLRHIEFKGHTGEIAQWFEKNKDGLVFDAATGKFRTP